MAARRSAAQRIEKLAKVAAMLSRRLHPACGKVIGLQSIVDQKAGAQERWLSLRAHRLACEALALSAGVRELIEDANAMLNLSGDEWLRRQLDGLGNGGRDG